MAFAASLPGAHQLERLCEGKLTSLLVVQLGKELNGTPPLLSGTHVATAVLFINKI